MKFLKNILSTLTALVVFSLLIVSITIGVFIGSSDEVEVKSSSILHIKLTNSLVDRQNSSEFNLVNSGYCSNSLISIQNAINVAKEDSLIKGIFLEIGELKGSLANVSSLKRNLESFKRTGRSVIVHSNGLSQIGYYLASSADSIFVNNMSNIEWKGLAAQLMYFKSMLDKIGVEAEPIRVGKFKSAIEPFIMDSMSLENEHQINEMLTDIWGNILQDVSKERGITVDTLNSIANDLGYLMADEALELGLIDGVKYEDQIYSCLDVVVHGKANLISVELYNDANKTFSFEESKIVVVNAEGAIVDANTDSDISSVKYSKIFDDLLKDNNVKAVVLRINSPGGSALASEKLWRKLKLISLKMPLVVSMGNYAASGGYYMASAGDTILAEKNTITGSIGVFGLLFNVSQLTDKVGVKIEKVKTNQMSDFPSFDRKLSEKEKNRMQQGITSIYQTFIQRVMDGRLLSKNDVEELAEGRVWTGSQAFQMGLVDKIGGLEESINIAANLAKAKEYKLLHLPKEKTPLEALVNQLSKQSQLRLPRPFSQYNYMIQNPEFFRSFSKPQARLPFVITIH
ncbi:MAG: signal peptide peptidase SppA [Flavobacteriales bacterium]